MLPAAALKVAAAQDSQGAAVGFCSSLHVTASKLFLAARSAARGSEGLLPTTNSGKKGSCLRCCSSPSPFIGETKECVNLFFKVLQASCSLAPRYQPHSLCQLASPFSMKSLELQNEGGDVVPARCVGRARGRRRVE